MAELLKSAATYKLAILVGIFFSLSSITSSIMTGLSGVDHWSGLTSTQQICIVCGILGSFANTMGAFINKTLARVEQGKPPIPAPDEPGTAPPFKADSTPPTHDKI